VDIFDLGLPVIAITNSPIVEADLPDFHFLIAGVADSIRAPALDELHGFFEARCSVWSEQEVQMVGHDDEFVHEVCASLTIMKESFNQDFGIFGDLEDGAALPAFCGDKVRGSRCGSVLRC